MRTIDTHVVEELCRWGSFAGVTTDTASLLRAGMSREEAVATLVAAQPGDVFVEVDGRDASELEDRAREVHELAPQRVMVRIPLSPDGLEVVHRLRDERIWTVATGIETFGQALLAVNSGADVLMTSLHEYRHELASLVAHCGRRGGRPRVLAARARDADDVMRVAGDGAWAVEIVPELARKLIENVIEGRIAP